MCFWCKFYLYQFSYSSPSFSHNTAVEKKSLALKIKKLKIKKPIKNKRSNVGNTYS